MKLFQCEIQCPDCQRGDQVEVLVTGRVFANANLEDWPCSRAGLLPDLSTDAPFHCRRCNADFEDADFEIAEPDDD